MLNLDDLGASGFGEEGLMDLRIAGAADRGGDIERTGAGAGALVRIVAVASCLIEDRIVRPPPLRPLARLRWKLLAEPSESLSYVGMMAPGLAIVAGTLCGRDLEAATAGGMFFFCKAPRSGFVSTGVML
jgi:hypothetical protein